MSAIGAAISGLQSSEQWLNVISNNIANSETVGYKSEQLNFADLISQDLSSASGDNSAANLGGIDARQVGLGVTVGSIATDIAQGQIETTGNVTDIAIQGQGYLTVRNGNNTEYTRAGNLTFDSNGDLVTASGGLVQGWSLAEQITPNAPPIAGGPPPPMQIIAHSLNTSNDAAIGDIVVPNNLQLAPSATSNNLVPGDQALGVSLAGNLDSSTPANAVIAAAGIDSGVPPTAANISVLVNNANATTNFTTYDSLGTAHNFTVYWVQTANVPNVPASWSYYVYDTDNGTAPNPAVNWPDAGAFIFSGGADGAAVGDSALGLITSTMTDAVTFNNDGSLATNGNGVNPGENNSIGLPINNGALGTAPDPANPEAFTFSIDLGTPNIPAAPPAPAQWGQSNGMTGDFGNGKVDPTTGVYTPVQTVYTKSVDGYSMGVLTGLSFNQTGGVEATFSNGQTLVIAQLAMSNFTNPGGLENAGGNYYVTSANSGSIQIGTAGANGMGTIQGGALEQSNVDLSVELTNMIVAQKMFESNSKVVTTDANILETLIQAVPAQ